MEKKKSTHIAGSIACGLLTAFGIAATVISMVAEGSNALWGVGYYINIFMLLLVFFYAFIGYKKAHGNLLKYIILIRAVPFLAAIYMNYRTGNTLALIVILLLAVEIGLLCYIAGRLAKVKENLVLMIIATVGLVAVLVLQIASGGVIATIGDAAPLITWLDICVAYFLRYKEHREAGLADAEKK